METKQQDANLKSKLSRLRSFVFGPPSSVFTCRRKAAGGFTMMELLVVVAVIAVLMGLSFPAFLSAIRRAKLTRARTEAQALQQAWLAYWNTYETWPGVTVMNPDAVAILGGDNPANIVFMEFDEVSRRDGFENPWDKLYQVEFVEADDIETDWVYQTRVYLANRSSGND